MQCPVEGSYLEIAPSSCYSGGYINLMSKSKYGDNIVRLKCTECGRMNYFTRRNKKTTEKLEISKFCKWDNKRTPHKEVKK
jgi:large subunit ribosomal protein L33